MTQRISDERIAWMLSKMPTEGVSLELLDALRWQACLDLRDARAQLAERDQRAAALEGALRTCAREATAWQESDPSCYADPVKAYDELEAIGEKHSCAINVAVSAALSPPPDASGGEKCEPAEGDAK